MINIRPLLWLDADVSAVTRTLENASATCLVLIILLLAGQPVCAQPRQAIGARSCVAAGPVTRQQFQSIMQTVADGWNRGDAQLAASCFAENAFYSSPPSRSHRGRNALYEFFGGTKGRELPMHMTWHHLVFDPIQQIGAGEYTFQYREQTHGVVIVKLSNGLILNWREYEVEANSPWEQFIGDNKF